VNVGRWIAQQAALAGDRAALADSSRTLDYAGLEERCARLARVLSEAGVRRGDRVALLLGNRSAFLEAVFAAARLGALSVPLNARLAPPEIAYLLADCTPAALLYEDAFAETVDRACRAVQSAPAFRLSTGGEPDAYEIALAGTLPAFDIAAVEPDDPMMILYTSGTTGVPKGAVLPHRKTLFNSLNAQLFFQITGADRVLIALPLFHSFGLNILALPVLYAGGSLILAPRFEPSSVWGTVSAQGISYFGAVPTMLQALLEALESAPTTRYNLRSLRFVFSAGAAIPVEVIRAFERHGLVVKQGFGQTETSILCCLDARDALRKAGSVGRPVFHAELRIVTQASLERPPSEWIDVPPHKPGEIVVRGPITMTGYWLRPEATAETIRDGWLRTGDLGIFDKEGFVTLVGRARDLYISGGENVYPAEVERVYAEHDAIREISVVGVPDAHWGEVGRAYVVLAPGKALDENALRAWGRERLAAFKIPQRFLAVSSLPRTETGKVQKHRLSEVA
jgi:fatty-acyl-CoA synthase